MGKWWENEATNTVTLKVVLELCFTSLVEQPYKSLAVQTAEVQRKSFSSKAEVESTFGGCNQTSCWGGQLANVQVKATLNSPAMKEYKDLICIVNGPILYSPHLHTNLLRSPQCMIWSERALRLSPSVPLSLSVPRPTCFTFLLAIFNIQQSPCFWIRHVVIKTTDWYKDLGDCEISC